MSEHEHTLAAALLQKPARLAEVDRVDVTYFDDARARSVFALSVGYFKKRKRRNALDFPLARSVLERMTGKQAKKAKGVLRVVEEYAGYAQITDAEFRDALSSLTSARRREALKKHGAKALEAALDGDTALAKKAMRRGLVEAEEADLEDDRPTDIRSALEVQHEREMFLHPPKGTVGGFNVGFPHITRCVSLRRRELWILGGYAKDGKTQASKALVYNANRHGARVLFVALEMDKREMIVLFVAQHAATLDPRGVRYRDILDNTASAQDRKLYSRALDDFEFKAEDDGLEMASKAGALHVWAPRKQITQANFEDRARAMNQDVGLDIVVKDYTELVKPQKDYDPRRQYRLDLKEMVERDKSLAREEDLLVIDNHQISRAGRDAAEKRKPSPHYLLRDLGESSGVERAADGMLWVYVDEDLRNDKEAKMGIAACRKGRPSIRGWHVMANYEIGVIADMEDDPATL